LFLRKCKISIFSIFTCLRDSINQRCCLIVIHWNMASYPPSLAWSSKYPHSLAWSSVFASSSLIKLVSPAHLLRSRVKTVTTKAPNRQRPLPVTRTCRETSERGVCRVFNFIFQAPGDRGQSHYEANQRAPTGRVIQVERGGDAASSSSCCSTFACAPTPGSRGKA
jgi:hypothetical protein